MANASHSSIGQRPTVLLTEGSSLSARQVLYCLGSRYTIDLLDPDPLCQCRFSRFVRRWYPCPSFSKEPEEYLRFLARRLRDERYDVLLPTHDQAYLLARFTAALRRRTGLALPEFEALERLQSKVRFARLLDELELPQPATRVIASREELEQETAFPFWVKLDFSTAGGGVRQVRSAEELRRVADEFESTDRFRGGVLVQQPARGVQSTVQTVFQHGRLVAAHSFEGLAIGVGGMSMARVSAVHPVVLEHVERLGGHLNWHGATFIDYFFDAATGRPEYIEANPRIGEPINALLSGVNLPERLVQVSLDQEVPRLPPGSPGVRTHSDFMILMARALEGAGRLDLVREIGRRRAGRGLYEHSEPELTRPRDDWMSLIPSLAVTLQLLALPSLARRIVQKTVDNYSLPDAAVQQVRNLPANLLDDIL